MLRVLVLFLAALPAFAQQGDLSLSGVVINSKTGEPIKRAKVTIIGFATQAVQRSAATQPVDPEQFKAQTHEAFSDSSGEFHFTELSAGRYTVSAQKPEFTPEFSVGKPVQSIDLSGPVSGIRVSLSPLGVITGKIVDQDGLPEPGINVLCLTSQILDGQMQVRADRTVATDDRGVYRFWNLTPGKYYVKAAGHGGGTAQTVGDSNRFIGDEGFAPIYFGGGNTLASTKPVEIGPGTEINADFSIKVEPAYRVSGTVANFVPRHTVSFQLKTSDDDLSAIRATFNSETGRFMLATPVVPGAYVLRATQDGSVAETPIVVRGGDLGEVALALSPPVDIPLVTRLTGTAPAQQAQFTIEGGAPQNCFARLLQSGSLVSTDPNVPFGAVAGRRQRSHAAISGVAPGRYQVVTSCYGAYPRSVVSGSHDLTADPLLTVEPGVTPPPIEILAAYGGGSIAGKIVSNVESANGLTVLLLPRFASAAGPQTAFSFRLPGADSYQFQFANLAPGAYTLHAFARNDIEYRNPEFLRTLPSGVAVEIDGDGKKEVTLEGVIQ